MDIEGAENSILADAASREVLCTARCVFLELHDRFAPGGAAALDAFLEAGCATVQPPVHFVPQRPSGEYQVFCQDGLD